jgi:hypothetical protein
MDEDIQTVKTYLDDHGQSDSQIIAMATGLSLDRVLLARLSLARADRGAS